MENRKLSSSSKDISLEIVVFTVNEHENICIAGLNHQSGYATAEFSVSIQGAYTQSFVAHIKYGNTQN